MLLNSSAWIELFLGTSKGKTVERWLKNEQVFASSISYAEITKWALRCALDPKPHLDYLESNAEIIPMDRAILVTAAHASVERRKIAPKWSLFDGIVYATAKINGLEVLTADHDFKGLENAVVID